MAEFSATPSKGNQMLPYHAALRLIKSVLPKRHRNNEDLINDCFLSYLQNLPNYDPQRCKESTFLCKFAKWTYLNHFRQLRKNRPSDPNFETCSDPDFLANQFQSTSASPYQLILLQQLVPADIDLHELTDAEIKLLAKTIRIKIGLQAPDPEPTERETKISETLSATLATKRRMEKRRMKVTGSGLDRQFKVLLNNKVIFKSPIKEDCENFIKNY